VDSSIIEIVIDEVLDSVNRDFEIPVIKMRGAKCSDRYLQLQAKPKALDHVPKKYLNEMYFFESRIGFASDADQGSIDLYEMRKLIERLLPEIRRKHHVKDIAHLKSAWNYKAGRSSSDSPSFKEDHNFICTIWAIYPKDLEAAAKLW